MNARKERAKAYNNQLNKQLSSHEMKPREKDEMSIEIGKFLLDLAKLTFAGVFLSGIMGLSVEILYLVLIGAIAIVLLAWGGFMYIKRGVNKK